MKFSALISSLVVVLPLVSQASGASFPGLVARQNGKQQGGGNNGGGGGNKNGKNDTNPADTNPANTTVTNSTITDGNNNTSTGNGTDAGGGDPQTSLTLDPAVIAPGFANDGQDVPTAGQVASKTSANNFINFCLLSPDLPITNGKQIATGSCNPAPMGVIPSSSNMPSAKFTNPANGAVIPADQALTISMAINNLATGNFVNAEANYFSAPQQVDGNGQVSGHSHAVVQALDALDQTTPCDPTKFAFFKGLNAAATGGVLTADVTNGLPAGAYRLCSINTAANHQPVLVPIAQHGSLDDCVYFTATAGGGNNSTAPPNNNGTDPASTNTGSNTTIPGGGNVKTGGGKGGKQGGNQGGKRDILRRRFALRPY